MDFGSLRALALDVNFSVHGLPATLELATGDRVTTRVIWLTPESDAMPVDEARGRWAQDTLQRRDPIRILAVRRSDVPRVPRGSVVRVAESGGGPIRKWTVDGHERTEADHHRVTVLRDPEDEDDEG